MTNIYKVIARDIDTGKQHKKWEYIGDKKFNDHSPGVIKRYGSGPMWNAKTYAIEIYKMINDEWERIDE